MATIFNPNELVLEKIRAVEEYNPSTDELMGRYTQIEDPSLKTSANATDVNDAIGTPITTFYTAQQGSFSFTNSLLSLDMLASQYGTTKTVAATGSAITMPVSETITIASDNTVTLKYVPVGTTGAEVKYVKVINDNNTFGETFTISATAGAGKFTLDVATKKITLPAGTTGRVFVNYNKSTETAVNVGKTTASVPVTRKLLIHAIFHDPCDNNIVYAGVIVCQRAQHDITSNEISLKSDGKHSANYKLQKPYCDESAKLFDIFVSQD
jgi:hypothetical protein